MSSFLNRLRAWWRRLRHPGAAETQMQADLDSYRQLLIDRFMERGLDREDARRRAWIEMDGVEPLKDKIRDVSWGSALDSFLRDLSLTIRSSRRNPVWTTILLLTLATTIGSTCAVFSLMNMVLFQVPAGIQDPEQLVEVMRGSGNDFVQISYPVYRHLSQNSQALQDLGARESTVFSVRSGAGPELLHGFQISENYFSVLGVPLRMGRQFGPSDAGRPVVIISFNYWQKHLGGSASVLAESIEVNGIQASIVGVLPEGFEPVPGLRRDLYVALGAPFPGLISERELGSIGSGYLDGIGRLVAGQTRVSAQAELNLLAESFIEQNAPGTPFEMRLDSWGPLPAWLRGPFTLFLSRPPGCQSGLGHWLAST